MKKLLFIHLFVFAALQVIAQQEATTKSGKKVWLWENGTWTYADNLQTEEFKPSKIPKLELPKFTKNDIIIQHSGFSLSYNELHEQANWVAYELTKEKTVKIYSRIDKFLEDPKVKTGTANAKDYASSGYDRGHLAPAADMVWSATAMAESFYYSNMSPQNPGFNRGIWKKLEELVRIWAVENEALYIATGPVLSGSLLSIGPNKVSVPKYYYKVILDYKAPEIKSIGFILENKNSNQPLQTYAVSIDSVEKFTGIDFFVSLPDEQEEVIEKKICLPCWSWDGVTPKNETDTIKQEQPSEENNFNKAEVKTSIAVQCLGITKAGTRCKRKTTNPSGRCYQH
ncbi:DNA/RNA non-specific endonuclease [Pedobacter puniceum]|jgi:endonuclease G|uniref:Endonuclease n=1 Tax=Pedobacter puniceum TaxID=2666136 RepID=A0A7K0FLJ5_9SPHI|nr:DNA/RNA non-specific endonuclease [Pedobacter puniceum]MRX46521.1 DNA/RNA non-specific endonuclease [Pedobacter puniceum]